MPVMPHGHPHQVPVPPAEEQEEEEDIPVPTMSPNLPGPLQISSLKRAVARVLKLGTSEEDLARLQVSSEQLAAVNMVANTKRDLLLCLATGAGKSMAYLAPTMLPEYRGTTVVIIPLRALQADVTERVAALGNGAIAWTGTAPQQDPPIIIVSAEKAIGNQFVTYLAHLEANKKLFRVVYDEVHLLLTSAYRQTLRSVLTITGKFYAPHLYLSATLPPHLEAVLRCELGKSTFVTIRGPSQRSNLAYKVTLKTSLADMEKELKEMVTTKLQTYDAGDRMVVFSFSKADAKLVQNLLGARTGLYHGDLSTPEKDDMLRAWKAGELSVMSSTSGFGVGVDYGRVRDVIIFGGVPRPSLLCPAGRSRRAQPPDHCHRHSRDLDRLAEEVGKLAS